MLVVVVLGPWQEDLMRRCWVTVSQIRGTDRDQLLDLRVLDRAQQGPPASLKVGRREGGKVAG